MDHISMAKAKSRVGMVVSPLERDSVMRNQLKREEIAMWSMVMQKCSLFFIAGN